jgi:LTR polyprotein gag-polypeptide-like protein
LKRKPVRRAEVKNTHGNVVTPAVDVNEDKLQHWEIKAEKAAGALKTAMSPDVKVLIRDGKDDPILIWDTLKTSFIQQCTAPCFNMYHALLSVQKLDSKSLEGLINRVDKHIRIIKSLSLSAFTMDNLYDELAVIAIIRALPHSFGNVICIISVLDKFDKQSVIQMLRNMDQTCSNLSGTSTAFHAAPAIQRASQRPSQVLSMSLSPSLLSTLFSPIQSKGSFPKCDFCSCLGHIEAKCFLKEKLMHQIGSLPSSIASPASTSPQASLQSSPSAPQSAHITLVSALSSITQSESYMS